MDLYQLITKNDGAPDTAQTPRPPNPDQILFDSTVTPDPDKGGVIIDTTIAADEDPSAINPLDHATSISEHGLEFVAMWEGFLSHATWDPFGHVWTIGIGETSGVHPGMVWTYQQALNDLRDRMASSYEPYVRATGQTYTQNQFDALCSFVWNIGPGSMSSSWTIGADLRAGNLAAAANSMLGYDRAGGVVLLGLERRRASERALFLTPEPPPPDPMLYARYPTNGFKHIDELRLVKDYDGLRHHGVRNRHKLKPVRHNLVAERSYIWDRAHAKDPKHPDWGTNWLGWRWQQINVRANGGVAKPAA